MTGGEKAVIPAHKEEIAWRRLALGYDGTRNGIPCEVACIDADLVNRHPYVANECRRFRIFSGRRLDAVTAHRVRFLCILCVTGCREESGEPGSETQRFANDHFFPPLVPLPLYICFSKNSNDRLLLATT